MKVIVHAKFVGLHGIHRADRNVAGKWLVVLPDITPEHRIREVALQNFDIFVPMYVTRDFSLLVTDEQGNIIVEPDTYEIRALNIYKLKDGK